MNHSPSPSKTKIAPAANAFGFPEAMQKIIDGYKVTKLEWESREYAFLNGEWLSLHKEDGKNYKWNINDGDMVGKDWVVYNDQPEIIAPVLDVTKMMHDAGSKSEAKDPDIVAPKEI